MDNMSEVAAPYDSHMRASHQDVQPSPFMDASSAIWFDCEPLARHLAGVGIFIDTAKPIRQFAGGLANRNYFIHIDGQPAVLRRPPSGDLPPGSHDMAREHFLLSRISGVFALAPRSLYFCDDLSIMGVPFQILEYRPGMVLTGSRLTRDLADHAPQHLSKVLVETLVAVHAIDTESCRLASFGRPDGFVQRTVGGWHRRGLAAAIDTRAATLIADISHWLNAQEFHQRKPTLLHMDFKLDNLIFAPETLRATTILDWDMGTRGDPLFDLATLLSYWCEPGEEDIYEGIDQMPTTTKGFWTRRDVIHAYATMTGRDVSDLPALQALALLRMGVVFLQLHRQWLSGAARDARYASFDRYAVNILQHARDLTKGKSHC